MEESSEELRDRCRELWQQQYDEVKQQQFDPYNINGDEKINPKDNFYNAFKVSKKRFPDNSITAEDKRAWEQEGKRRAKRHRPRGRRRK